MRQRLVILSKIVQDLYKTNVDAIEGFRTFAANDIGADGSLLRRRVWGDVGRRWQAKLNEDIADQLRPARALPSEGCLPVQGLPGGVCGLIGSGAASWKGSAGGGGYSGRNRRSAAWFHSAWRGYACGRGDWCGGRRSNAVRIQLRRRKWRRISFLILVR
jgi:hypothetical protein